MVQARTPSVGNYSITRKQMFFFGEEGEVSGWGGAHVRSLCVEGVKWGDRALRAGNQACRSGLVLSLSLSLSTQPSCSRFVRWLIHYVVVWGKRAETRQLLQLRTRVTSHTWSRESSIPDLSTRPDPTTTFNYSRPVGL